MPIINTVYPYEFYNAFQQSRPDNFNRDGLEALYTYLEELSEDLGENIELDVIALCCDYTQDDYASILNNFDIDIADCEDEDEIQQAVVEYLESQTQVIYSDNETVLYQQF